MSCCPNCGSRIPAALLKIVPVPGVTLGLTARQQQCLSFVHRYRQLQHGVSPSYDEIKTALGLKSKSGVHRLVQGLAARGHISRVAKNARSIAPVESG
jgi:repressor LexA